MIKESKLIGTQVPMPYGWSEFKVGDLFDVSGTHGFDKGDIVLGARGTEFIGRTEINNGVQGFYDDLFVAPNEANTISISQIGAQTAQYRRNQWYASQNLFKLLPKFDMHERHALFLLGFINKGLSIYSGYSHFPKIVDIADMQLVLPVTQDGQPDYGWMSSYIRELENQRIRELDTYLQVAGLDDTTLTDNELQVVEQWRQHEKSGGGTLLTKRFKVGELFDISRGDISNQNLLVESDSGIPLVLQNDTNNGVDGRRFTHEGRVFGANSMVIGRQTGVMYTIPYDFITTDGVLVLTYDDASELSNLFIISLLKSAMSRYGFTNTVSATKLNDLSIELPVTADGTPDYEFMETFIRAQEKLVMTQLSDFRAKKIAETKALIRP